MKYNDNGTWKEIYVKALDSMPVGTEVVFDGQASDIPVGWEQTEDKGEVYSTTEQKIGTWIDGKPLYRKVIEVTATTPSNSRIIIDFSNYNIDEIIKDYEICYLASSQYTGYIRQPMPKYNTDSLNSWGISKLEMTSSNMQIFCGNAYNSFKGYVILEYTKTTDQGGNA